MSALRHNPNSYRLLPAAWLCCACAALASGCTSTMLSRSLLDPRDTQNVKDAPREDESSSSAASAARHETEPGDEHTADEPTADETASDDNDSTHDADEADADAVKKAFLAAVQEYAEKVDRYRPEQRESEPSARATSTASENASYPETDYPPYHTASASRGASYDRQLREADRQLRDGDRQLREGDRRGEYQTMRSLTGYAERPPYNHMREGGSQAPTEVVDPRIIGRSSPAGLNRLDVATAGYDGRDAYTLREAEQLGSSTAHSAGAPKNDLREEQLEASSRSPRVEPTEQSDVGGDPEPKQPQSFQQAVDDAIRLLREDLRAPADEESPDFRVRREIALRLLRMTSLREADREQAAAAIHDVSADEAEFWQNVLYAIKEFQTVENGALLNHRSTAALASLRRAESALSNLGMLEVRNLKLCSEVRSFGRYEEFPEAQFLPGQEVIVYAEVYNFATEAKHSGYETALKSSYEMYDSQGVLVDGNKYNVERELCASRRRDFYFPHKIRLPVELRPGRYTLTLTIKDELANKFDQQSIGFTISSNR
ncbi:MAG: hypothetical protein RIC55_35015 [Pirellulaceae bacterium]